MKVLVDCGPASSRKRGGGEGFSTDRESWHSSQNVNMGSLLCLNKLYFLFISYIDAERVHAGLLNHCPVDFFGQNYSRWEQRYPLARHWVESCIVSWLINSRESVSEFQELGGNSGSGLVPSYPAGVASQEHLVGLVQDAGLHVPSLVRSTWHQGSQ